MAEAATQGEVHQFGNISLSSRGGAHAGQLRITPNGIAWRSQTGGRTVEVKKDDIAGLVWTKVGGRGCQLGVERRASAAAAGAGSGGGGLPTVNLVGFRDADRDALAGFFTKHYNRPLATQQLSVAGRNWGALTVTGASLKMAARGGGGVVFEVPLPDVSGAQAVRDELLLEFHVDDTAAGGRDDALVEMGFHVPPGCKDWAPPPAPEPAPVADGDEPPPPPPAPDAPAKVLLDALLPHTDAGAGAAAADAVATFDDVAVVAPRGRFDVELHSGFMKLAGQAQDFKIRYESVVRLFVLPRAATRHVLVVVSLDPPIRKGQTFYPHLLCQFPEDEETTATLSITDEALTARNEKGARLAREMSGKAADVFARTLRGLSGAKLSRTGAFTSAGGLPSVRCTYKADDGLLYPLERAFFYIHKPPMLFMHDDIESIEFQRQGGGVVAGTVRTFDLVVRTRHGGGEFQFRSIDRGEWQGLFNFINGRHIRIENLRSAQQGPQGPGRALEAGGGGGSDDDDDDAGMRAARAEAGDDDDDDEDEDFDGGKAGGSGSDSGSGSDDSDASGSDSGSGSDASGSEDAEVVSEEGIDAGAVFGAKAASKRRRGGGGGSGSGSDEGEDEEDEDGGKPAEGKKSKKAAGAGGGAPAKKPRRKKDPSAPKKATSAFMYFSAAGRERVKRDNPGIAFGAIAKLLGEEWKALDAAGRAEYEAKAAADKARYDAEMAAYRARGGGEGGGGGEGEGGAEAGGGGGGNDDGWASDGGDAGGDAGGDE